MKALTVDVQPEREPPGQPKLRLLAHDVETRRLDVAKAPLEVRAAKEAPAARDLQRLVERSEKGLHEERAARRHGAGRLGPRLRRLGDLDHARVDDLRV